MTSIKVAAREFQSHKRVAVTGVSRTPKDHGSSVVHERLRERGYEVFAVNPNSGVVEGDASYSDLNSIPGGVDWFVIGTKPETAEMTVHECVEIGIDRAWMHHAFGVGSVSAEGAEIGRRHGTTIIAKGCPCMFGPTSDLVHKVIRVMCTMTRAVPGQI